MMTVKLALAATCPRHYWPGHDLLADDATASAEIVNYLLTAYCPTCERESGLSDREKREKMHRFSTQAYTIVH